MVVSRIVIVSQPRKVGGLSYRSGGCLARDLLAYL